MRCYTMRLYPCLSPELAAGGDGGHHQYHAAAGIFRRLVMISERYLAANRLLANVHLFLTRLPLQFSLFSLDQNDSFALTSLASQFWERAHFCKSCRRKLDHNPLQYSFQPLTFMSLNSLLRCASNDVSNRMNTKTL